MESIAAGSGSCLLCKKSFSATRFGGNDYQLPRTKPTDDAVKLVYVGVNFGPERCSNSMSIRPAASK